MTDKIMELINWWLQGLLILCPSFLRRFAKKRVNQVVIQFDDNLLSAKHYDNDLITPSTTHTFHTDNELDKAAALKFLSEQKKNNAIIILALPENIILQKSLAMPLVAKSELRQALGFELNRKTPFTAEQVFFDYTSTQKDDKLNINLFIAPISRVEPILEKAQLLGIHYDKVSFENNTRANTEINLVKQDTDSNGNNRFNRFTATLAVLVISLFITLLYLPVYLQNQELAQLERDVNKKRKGAIQLQSLIKEKDIIFEQSHFLSNKREEQISSIELINEMTRIIPDDTWLSRLIIKSGEIQLQGESGNASALLQLIESSELFSNAQFRSPITKNNATQKDRFNLSAEINKDETTT